jgi:hypothetical protein
MNQLMAMSSMLPETGRHHVIEDTIASMTGFNSLERYFPVPEKDPMQDEHEQEAARENALFKLGEPFPASENDNHAIHAESHLTAGFNVLNQQGGDKSQLAGYLQLLLNHTSEHMDSLSQDNSRKEKFKELNKAFQELVNSFKNIGQQAQQEQQAQAQAAQEEQAIQEGGDAKDRVLQLRAERDMARKDVEASADIQRKQMQAQTDMEIKRAKAASDVRP